jgi:hypothetical protein
MTTETVEQIDLFRSWGNKSMGGNVRIKVETFDSDDRWGEYEAGKRVIRLHSNLSKRDAFLILFHEAAHGIWDLEKLGKKEDEETVCSVIAEGLAQMVIGSKLESFLSSAKAEAWEVPGREKRDAPRVSLALDCEGIEAAVAANKCVRNAPMDYMPWDMRYGKKRNRHLVRQGVKALRSARERLFRSMDTEPAHLWAIQFSMVEMATYSLRVRSYWRHGHREDFVPPISKEDAP